MDIQDQAQWDTPAFPVALAAKAAGIAAPNLRMWFQRGRIALHPMDAAPDKNGLPRLLTLRTMLTIAATAALVRQGVKVEQAYGAAKAWTHLGDAERDPSSLYPDPSLTFLAYYSPNHADVIRGEIRRDQGKGWLAFEYQELQPPGYPEVWAVALVPLNKVDQIVRSVCRQFLVGRDGSL